MFILCSNSGVTQGDGVKLYVNFRQNRDLIVDNNTVAPPPPRSFETVFNADRVARTQF